MSNEPKPLTSDEVIAFHRRVIATIRDQQNALSRLACSKCIAEKSTEKDGDSTLTPFCALCVARRFIHVEAPAHLKTTAELIEAKAAIQGRTVSCVCGAEAKVRDLEAMLAFSESESGKLNDSLSELIDTHQQTMTKLKASEKRASDLHDSLLRKDADIADVENERHRYRGALEKVRQEAIMRDGHFPEGQFRGIFLVAEGALAAGGKKG